MQNVTLFLVDMTIAVCLLAICVGVTSATAFFVIDMFRTFFPQERSS